MPNHLDRMMITNAQMTRWHHAAARLGDGGLELRSELENLARDPTRHMLLLAANAARHAGRLSIGVRAELGDAVATELEEAAEGNPSV